MARLTAATSRLLSHRRLATVYRRWIRTCTPKNHPPFGLTDRLLQAIGTVSNETGDTVDLAILRGSKKPFIDRVVGTHGLRAVSSIGETITLTDTANGKVALACLERQEAVDLIVAELGNPESSP